MTQEFMTSSVIREKYGITGDATFDETFSKVSIENIWFSIVASAIWALESIYDSFRADVDEKIAGAVLASIPWYHKISLEFQYGDSLVFDDETQQYVYPEIDAEKQVVKFAACRDIGGGVYVLAAGADASGNPVALSAAVQAAFESYLRQRKPAGVILQVGSYDPDLVRVAMTVQYDPQILNATGQLIADTSVRPVEDAINTYLHNIVYGGVLNKSKLIDAVQAAPGVVDVVLSSVAVKSENMGAFVTLTANNYTSYSGAFESDNLTSGISYVLSL